MGSDRKSKEEKKSKKRTTTYSSASEDEGRSKRQRSGEREERKRRSDRKEKKKDKKSHKHRSDKEEKSKDKHKSKHRKGEDQLKNGFQKLSSGDYFSKNNEFATWLKEEKNTFFSDLSSDSARELFTVFVKDWNNQRLELRYYEGIVSGPRSAHNWKIKQ